MSDGYELRARYVDNTLTRPLSVIEWHDAESGATGFLAINSLRNGAAGGGTRVKVFASDQEARDDAIQLAKTMELKFRVSGPDIGGAKSVINFRPPSSDPHEARRQRLEVAKRWWKFLRPVFESYYGTGGDQNVDDGDVIGAFHEMGLRDPQQGIVRGLYGDDHYEARIANLREGVLQPIKGLKIGNLQAKVADYVTGYGVACSIDQYYRLQGDDSVKDKRILMEGFGNVGAAAAIELQKRGARIVGIITAAPLDRAKRAYVASADGLDVNKHIDNRVAGCLDDGTITDAEDETFWATEADVFVPAATSNTVDVARLASLIKSGVKVMSAGANVPFVSVDVERQADRTMAIVPDFVANSGMARTFAYLMERTDPVGKAVWNDLSKDVDARIGAALEAIGVRDKPNSGLLDRSYAHYIALINNAKS